MLLLLCVYNGIIFAVDREDLLKKFTTQLTDFILKVDRKMQIYYT